MGNCQAAEVAAVVVQHPGNNGKVDRYNWTTSAEEVMRSNPGHYVALVVNPTPNGKPQLKLLRPTDCLHVGHVYRLITFEDVIKEFAAKKSAKLGKLLKESGALSLDNGNTNNSDAVRSKLDFNQVEQGGNGSSISRSTSSRRVVGGSQWKPALQSIAEIESSPLNTLPFSSA